MPGTTLQNGRYIIDTRLGSGGMGGVYRAHDEVLGRTVAIKELLTPNIETLAQEARILARLSHPSVVGVNDFFCEDGVHYLTLDYIEGQDLQSLLDTHGRASLTAVLDWTAQICDALEYLHANRVLLRDLKPSNVMLSADGRVRLIDFGIARQDDGDSGTASAIKGYGTDGFAPIEQYGGGHTDTRSDIYALGATVYALLSGRRPPPSVRLVTGDAVLAPLSHLNPDLPPALDAVIACMLATRKEDRYATVAQARRALQEACAAPAPAEPQPSIAPVAAVTRPLAAAPTAPLPAPISSTSVFAVEGRAPLPMARGPISGGGGLRLLDPYTVLYRGTRDGASAALENSSRAGISGQMLAATDPYLTARPQPFVVIAHIGHLRGGADAWARPVAS